MISPSAIEKLVRTSQFDFAACAKKFNQESGEKTQNNIITPDQVRIAFARKESIITNSAPTCNENDKKIIVVEKDDIIDSDNKVLKTLIFEEEKQQLNNRQDYEYIMKSMENKHEKRRADVFVRVRDVFSFLYHDIKEEDHDHDHYDDDVYCYNKHNKIDVLYSLPANVRKAIEVQTQIKDDIQKRSLHQEKEAKIEAELLEQRQKLSNRFLESSEDSIGLEYPQYDPSNLSSLDFDPALPSSSPGSNNNNEVLLMTESQQENLNIILNQIDDHFNNLN